MSNPGQIRRALGALGTVEVQKEIAPAVGSEPLGAGHLEDHPTYIPSGKRLHNYGKSLFLKGKSTISMAINIQLIPSGNGDFYH